MNCPYCNGNSRVVDSRPLIDSIRRRRECVSCLRRFTTYEKFAPAEIRVIKQNSRSPEEFKTDKLVVCLERVCRGCSIDKLTLLQVARSIEAEIVDRGRGQIRSSEIATIVAARLRELGEILFQRFAINYLNENGRSRLDQQVDQAAKGGEHIQFLLFDDVATKGESG